MLLGFEDLAEDHDDGVEEGVEVHLLVVLEGLLEADLDLDSVEVAGTDIFEDLGDAAELDEGERGEEARAGELEEELVEHVEEFLLGEELFFDLGRVDLRVGVVLFVVHDLVERLLAELDRVTDDPG